MSIPTAVWSGEFEIVPGVTLKVHVLDDGQRIIEEESFAAFLEWMGLPDTVMSDEIAFRIAKAVKGR